jgi:hypothetical protein
MVSLVLDDHSPQKWNVLWNFGQGYPRKTSIAGVDGAGPNASPRSSMRRPHRERGTDRSRSSPLVKVLGLLGSAHDGERAAAAQLASDMVRAANASWDQLLDDRVAIAAARRLLDENEELREQIARLHSMVTPRSPAPWRDSARCDDAVEALVLWEEYLTDWEREFLASPLRRHCRLTPKQIAVLTQIGVKVDGCIRVDWRAA